MMDECLISERQFRPLKSVRRLKMIFERDQCVITRSIMSHKPPVFRGEDYDSKVKALLCRLGGKYPRCKDEWRDDCYKLMKVFW